MTTTRPAALAPAADAIRPRYRGPNARAVVGGFAVAAAAVLVFGAYLGTRPSPGRPEVVASASLAAGTVLRPGDLRTVDAHLPGATAGQAFRSPGSLLGRTLTVRLDHGELVTPAELTPNGAAPRLRPVPVTVAASDLVDLGAGDRVDVLVTEGSAPKTTTTIIVRGAQVISTTQPPGGLTGASGGSDVVTLGVAILAEVEAVVSAEHAGTLDVVVGESGDGTGLGASPSPGRT